ncbi:sialomucin core protein 24 isoform X2 [Pseudonaja textilis]|uniref:sialomucin core protein 24 isoform X2 n=1 Tax=Pseudonaja textilis TaxID=8673 RepID=UPI000EA876F0|nr:sialomucin core protein 24 isoform X2 [Pseudonaja textilis]
MNRYSRQRYLWDTLAWSLLLTVVLASCLIPQSKAAVEEVGCERHTNCSSCIAIESSQLNCTWLQCTEGNKSRCTNSSSTFPDCIAIPENGTCAVFPVNATTPSTTTTVTSPTGSTINSTSTGSPIKNSTTFATTSVITDKTGTSALIPTTKPSHHKASFDAASFIGGIVLVLGLQAVIFFLYKFCKSKEQNYHTL